MAALYSHTTRATGTTLTAAIYNSDHQNHIDNGIPAQLDDYSASAGQMQTATDPGEAGSESLPTSLAGELERLRFAIKEVKTALGLTSAQWYSTLTGAVSISRGGTGATTAAGAKANLGISTAPVAITGNITLTNADVGIPKKITTSAIVTLPAANTITDGAPLQLTSYTTGDVTIVRAGADTIQGSLTTVRLASYETIELVSDGTADYLITKKPAWEVGNVKAHDASAIPHGWNARDAAAISRSTYAGLFAVLGTTHGAGDGATTFNTAPSAGRSLVGSGAGTVSESVTNAAINTGTDAITVTSNNDKWKTGQQVTWTVSGTPPTTNPANLLDNSDTVFVVRINTTTIKFATSLANAQNSTVIDITAAGSGTFTITRYLTTRTIGEQFGDETTAIDSTQNLAHTHGPGAGTYLAGVSVGALEAGYTGGGPNLGFGTTQQASTATASSGGNVALNTQSPASVTNYIIKT